jgi:tetratricopeptide (TPR) repeat protein
MSESSGAENLSEKPGSPDSDAESLELKLPGESSSPKELALWAGVLVLLTLISYWPATTGGFVWRDDLLAQKPWIYAPGGLSLVWMARWSQPGDYVINSPLYQPVALTAYWLEYRLGGRGTDGRPSPMAYHVASLIFHAGAAVLLWLVLRELLVPAAWMITAIFALHPIHSEPISWISEQATVLAGMFFIGSIYCYLMFLNWRARDVAERAAGGEGVDLAQTWGLYAGSVVAFLLAILSDPSTVMLPIILLLLLWWRKRLTSQDGLLITPMAIIAAVLWISTATLHSGRYEDILLNVRSVPELVMLGRGIWFSLLRTFVPAGLSVLDLSNLQLSSAAAAFFIGVVMVIVLLIGGLLATQLQPSRTGQRTPASSALVALTAFLLLVITGLNWFDPTRLSLVTDCVGYLAIVPIVALVVGFVSRFKLPGPYPQSAVTVSTVVLIGFGLLSWLRTQAFDSPVALWRDVVAKAPASAFGHEELAEQLRLTAIEDFAVQDKDATKAHRDEAIQNAREAAELDPANFRPQQTWARVLTDRGDDAQALPHYQMAIALAPNIASLHTDYSAVLIQLGRFKQAIPELIAALQLDSGSSDAFRLLGEAHAGLGEIKEALVAENQAILLNPANFLAMQKLAEFQAKGGKPDDLKAAINTYFKLMGESKQMTRPDIWLAISKIKRQQGDLEHALEFLKENETYAKDDRALSKQYENEIQSITRSLATRPSTRSSTQASTMPATTQAVKE